MRSFWLFCLSASLWGQTLTLPHFQEGSASLAGPWRFHPGDDPSWADPNFDDSGWKLLRMTRTLKEQGYPNFQGYGWYRLHLRWEEQSRPSNLVLQFSHINNVGEAFANNASVCRFGSFPPHPQIYFSRPILCSVASERWAAEGRLLLAVRVWKDPKLVFLDVHSGLDEAAPEIGLPLVMQSRMDAAQYALLKQRWPDAFISCVELILALYLFALAFTKTRRPEYFWFGLLFCTDVVHNSAFWIGQNTFWLTANQATLLRRFSLPLSFWFLVCGLWFTFGEKVGPAVRWFFAFMLAATLVDGVVLVAFGPWKFFMTPANPLLWLSIMAHLIVLGFLVRHTSRQFGEARWLAISFAIAGLTGLSEPVLYVLPHLHINQERRYLIERLAFAGSLLTLGYLLIRRFGQAQAEGERFHAEIAAAHEIQSLLLPAKLLSTAGFTMEAAYLPAQEVGGDFFQVTTASDGSLLLAMGDVSGKGLQAALTVSLVVGLWKETTAHSSSPAEILTQFNRQLTGSLKGGFVTCLCARLQPDGPLTLANAGHLAPYVNGTELTTQNGLPLGVLAQSEYEESQHRLAAPDTLVFVSDGVVEARDKERNLFGFERLQQALSEHLGADAIAHSAQQFGQEDDITVITISRQAVETKPLLPAQAAAV